MNFNYWTPKLVVLYILMKWYISEDMMPFGGEYVMFWRISGYKLFFFIIRKHRNWQRCSLAQFRLMLHLLFHLLERSIKLWKYVRWTDKPPYQCRYLDIIKTQYSLSLDGGSIPWPLARGYPLAQIWSTLGNPMTI